ncbi:MAG: hypothetical protein D6704_06615 [Nitrospirae bacterium]|nr:MAG: hypothetical protein D6704_06615 [Nitrospirota bacterium]
MGNIKLGLLIVWPTFWTGFPLKLAIALLLLAAGLHPWEGLGLAILLLVSIPIDIWALGLCARTVFLERLRIEPPAQLGVTLWWQWALWSVVYLPVMYLVIGGVAHTAESVAKSFVAFLKESVIPALPIAEQIALELTLWGSVAAVVFLLMLMGWLYGLGLLANRHVRAGQPVEGPLQEVVYRWDLLRIPSDQPLMLTAFVGVGTVLILLFWGFLPVSTPHPHEDYEFVHVAKKEKPVNPKEVITKAEQVIAQAELTLEELTKEQASSSGGRSKAESAQSSRSSAVEGAAQQTSMSATPDAHSHDDHSHGNHEH